jgi:putative nucleotidyltransferase with HDIG domain
VVGVDRAKELAGSLLAGSLPRRWSHVQAVGRKAERIGDWVVGEDAATLAAAAWLHDVGYAPTVAETGFHPLDGARWLRRAGVDERVTALVAHHSCALLEAEERGLADVLRAEFSEEASATADALWYCDMTTDPDGQPVRVEDRIAETVSRYGPDDPVTRFIVRAMPVIVGAVRRTEERLRGAEAAQPM